MGVYSKLPLKCVFLPAEVSIFWEGSLESSACGISIFYNKTWVLQITIIAEIILTDMQFIFTDNKYLDDQSYVCKKVCKL